MKDAILGGISFFIGAAMMYWCLPGELSPDAYLNLRTDRGDIHIPMRKKEAVLFTNIGTNLIQIYGIGVSKTTAK